MKEIMGQYGRCMIAVVIAGILFGSFGSVLDRNRESPEITNTILSDTVTGEMPSGNQTEFERYWRIR